MVFHITVNIMCSQKNGQTNLDDYINFCGDFYEKEIDFRQEEEGNLFKGYCHLVGFGVQGNKESF